MVTLVPEVLENIPLSPTLYSTLHTTVPSGMELMGKTFPMEMEALLPQYTY
eukprot:CAMPEP_0197387590 /NCGR_PEP_ID=MMETSP1165-20131217/617_1 /TAXON_ID=284809 /ORGANISM="Chrysocystis fragilis, Strain CCMP3189" /LENGTH=50 /DNA_ID=CAMNT_0042912921 /DNA_START=357 /DNA_END=509 /DNA_ORIENTATION=+